MKIYELEEKIMAAWSTAEDIKVLYEQYLDGKTRMTEDEVANVLLGIKSLHELRMQQVWSVFEDVVSQGI